MNPTFRFLPVMAHAVITHRKTQTRRVLRLAKGSQQHLPFSPVGSIRPLATSWAVHVDFDATLPSIMDPEVIAAEGGIWHAGMKGAKPEHMGKLRPAMFLATQLYGLMPQIETLAERVEPLQDITEPDALSEGISQITKDQADREPEPVWKYGIADRDGLPGNDDFGWQWNQWCLTAIGAYHKLWDDINHTRGFGWSKNPLVSVTTFKLL